MPARDPRKSSTELGGAPLVLSVDDDPINQMVVENLLTPEGYEVRGAQGYAMRGVEGSQVAGAEGYDQRGAQGYGGRRRKGGRATGGEAVREGLVLSVDYDTINQMVVEDLLTHEGCEVRGGARGADGDTRRGLLYARARGQCVCVML